MSEAELAEVEKTLLYISEARQRAERAHAALKRGGAEDHVISALEETERVLSRQHQRLMQQTYFAVPSDQEKLAV